RAEALPFIPRAARPALMPLGAVFIPYVELGWAQITDNVLIPRSNWYARRLFGMRGRALRVDSTRDIIKIHDHRGGRRSRRFPFERPHDRAHPHARSSAHRSRDLLHGSHRLSRSGP